MAYTALITTGITLAYLAWKPSIGGVATALLLTAMDLILIGGNLL